MPALCCRHYLIPLCCSSSATSTLAPAITDFTFSYWAMYLLIMGSHSHSSFHGWQVSEKYVPVLVTTDSLTERPPLPPWQRPKWQIDQIFSSVTQKIFSLLDLDMVWVSSFKSQNVNWKFENSFLNLNSVNKLQLYWDNIVSGASWKSDFNGHSFLMIIIIHFKCWCWEETSCFYQQPWEGPWQSRGRFPGRGWCWSEGGDVIAATFSQINIVNIITAPRCTSSPHNYIVHSSRRNYGTIKIAVPSYIPSFNNQTFRSFRFSGQVSPGAFSKCFEYQCQNWRRLESIKVCILLLLQLSPVPGRTPASCSLHRPACVSLMLSAFNKLWI